MAAPFGLDKLSEGQRRALLVAAPLVAAVAVGSLLGKRSADAKARAAADAAGPEDGTTPTGYIPPASTDVVGVGQLAEFESIIAGSIHMLTEQQRRLEDEVKKKPAATEPAKPTAGDVNAKCINLWGTGALVSAEQSPAAFAYVSAVAGGGGWNDPGIDMRRINLYNDGSLFSVRELAAAVRTKGTPTNKTVWSC